VQFFGNTYRVLRLLPFAVGAAGGLLYFAAAPGIGFSEGAWLWAVPFLLWAATKPTWKQWLFTAGVSMWLAKIATLVWLRHVYPPLGWLGLVLLTASVAAFPFAWLALARRLFPKATGAPVTSRIAIQFGLAGAWVLLEWLQSWIFTGFPWVLLAETQWRQPVVLSLCAWGGPWAPAFAIILFNTGLSRYILRYFEEREKAEEAALKARREEFAERMKDAADGGGRFGGGFENRPLRPAQFPNPFNALRRVCPEFYLGVLPVFLGILSFVRASHTHTNHAETFFTAAAIQTDFDPNAKWDPKLLRENTDTVATLINEAAKLSEEKPIFEMAQATAGETKKTAPTGKNAPALAAKRRTPPQVIFLPEAALPYHISEVGYQKFLTDLAEKNNATLLVGVVGESDGGYYNGIHSVTPGIGVDMQNYYAKRHLVPFGEYVPLADILPLRKVVPVEKDCLPGKEGSPLPLTVWKKDSPSTTAAGLNIRLRKKTSTKKTTPETAAKTTPETTPEISLSDFPATAKTFQAGSLVCYEDVFPELARDMVLHGADFLAVLTNDAWYGREAGAYQHASHSAVLAASLGVPVVRCGNNGWSGVFNALGQQMPMLNRAGSIYFRGAGYFEVRGFPVAFRTQNPTLYTTRGNWMVKLSALLVAWVVLRNIPFRRKKPIREKKTEIETVSS
jgi:apolipoprotein N-acyltransferase